MGLQGLYLNQWTLNIDPTQDVSSAVPVWIHLPHLRLRCWSSKSLELIGNALGKYIEREKKKDQYSCMQICVEVDLVIGIPEAIKIVVAYWTHVQELDYEKISFKCNYFHNYGHFSRNCKKKVEEEAGKMKGEQWMKV
jgi:hypothetical protein